MWHTVADVSWMPHTQCLLGSEWHSLPIAAATDSLRPRAAGGQLTAASNG